MVTNAMKTNLRLLLEARQSRTVLVVSILLLLMGGTLGITQAHLLTTIINQVFLGGGDLNSVSRIFMAALLVILVRAGCTWAGELASSSAARRITQSLRLRLFSHIAELGPAYLRGEAGEKDARTGELLNLSIQGIDALEVYFNQYLPQVVLALVMPVVILAVVFPSDLLSGFVLLLTAPLLPLFMILIGSTAQALTRRQWLGLSCMNAYFLDIIQGLTTLKALGRSREQTGVIAKVSERYRSLTMDVLRVTFLSTLVQELVATLSTAVIAVEIGIRLLHGQLAFEQAFFILLLTPEFYLPLRLLGVRYHAGMAGMEAAKRLFSILDLPIPAHAGEAVGSVDLGDRATPPWIEFREVSYRYSDAHPALQEVSFSLPAGKITALAGESGAGKTTLSWLLLHFLQPQSGQIRINGTPLDEIPATLWWDQIAWVPQHPYLFKDTLAANIRLAKPDASHAEVIQAASLAHADEFIRQLPQGYATQVGERGVMLSGGQAQRIALARALLKNAPLIILDEPASQVDPEAVDLLHDAISKLAPEHTLLVIAHHRATLALADQVVTLKHGKVVSVETVGHSKAAKHPEPVCLPSPSYQPLGLKQAAPRAHPQEIEKPSFKKPAVLRLLGLLSEYKGRLGLSLLLGFAAVASSIGLMTTSAYIISAAALQPSIADLQVAIVGVRFFGLARGVFRYLERLTSHDLTLRLLSRWRVWFYQALEPLAPARLMQHHSGDLLSRVMGDIASLENFYVRAVSPPAVALLVGIVACLSINTLGSILAWTLAAFLLFAGVGLPILSVVLARRMGAQLAQARGELSTRLLDGFQGLADLLVFNQANAQRSEIEKAAAKLAHQSAFRAGLAAMNNAVGAMLSHLAMFAVLAVAVERVSAGALPGVLLGVAAIGTLACFEAVLPVPAAAEMLDENRAAAERLYELVDATPAVSEPAVPISLPRSSELEIEQLSFAYPVEPPASDGSSTLSFQLQDVSFSLPQGSHLAILGPNGSGKTTLVNLLLRYWDYPAGSIRWGGVELKDLAQNMVRQQIAVVSQQTYLFSATLKENLLIARPDATLDEMMAAAKAAHLDEKIQSLPQGYDTWLGEQGFHLSAGERQRLAIARMMLKNPALLILDEPTANLDAETESQVLQSILEFSRGRSTILITQNIHGLESMHQIMVLNQGQIIERGTHQELLALGGAYSRMWAMSAAPLK